MVFTGKLTGNRRDVEAAPKALIIGIDPDTGLERTHCWVLITEYIANIQPRGHQKPIGVEFEAELKPYLKQGTIQQYTLTKIKNIRRIK